MSLASRVDSESGVGIVPLLSLQLTSSVQQSDPCQQQNNSPSSSMGELSSRQHAKTFIDYTVQDSGAYTLKVTLTQ